NLSNKWSIHISMYIYYRVVFFSCREKNRKELVVDIFCKFDYSKITMKRIYASSIIALLTFAFVFSVRAQNTLELNESTTNSTPSQRRETVTQQVEETNTNIIERRENLRQEMQQRREDFADRVAEIKDTRRQALVERIDEKVNDLNERHSEKLEDALTRMQTVLDSIETK